VLGELDVNHMIEAARLPATLLIFGAALAVPNWSRCRAGHARAGSLLFRRHGHR